MDGSIMAGTRLVEIEDLTVQFVTREATVNAVNGVSLRVNSGEVLCILGESGSGKSVTLRALMRLLPVGRTKITGSMKIDGQDVMTLDRRGLQKLRGGLVSMIFQEPMTALDPVYTVGEQIIETVRQHKKVSRAEARASLHLLETAFVVVSAARLSPEKGLDVLLQAARLRKQMTFLIAGDGPQGPMLTRDLPPNVTLLGTLADIRPLLFAADVFAMPSRREGQGIAALEAMAAGVPVVASRVGGLAEMLTDGETALLVAPNDPDALAVAFSRLQSDRRLRGNLAERASALVQSRYSLPTMLDTLSALYQDIGAKTAV